MRVGVIANADDADDGYVGERLRELGASIELHEREDLDRLARAGADADVLVLLGSDWSVYDPRHAASVAAESAVVARALEQRQPTLAICYGAQLAAHSLGLRVQALHQPEIGWTAIEAEDKALSGTWFQLHFDHFVPDPRVQTLARNERCAQAFSIGTLLAVQFHPEVSPATAGRWLRGLPAGLGLDLDALEHETQRRGPQARRSCHRLVDAFLSEMGASLPSFAPAR